MAPAPADPAEITFVAWDQNDNKIEKVLKLRMAKPEKQENAEPIVLEFTSPQEGEPVKGMVTFRLNTNNVLMEQVELPLPDGTTAYLMKKLPYEWNWDSTQVQDGDYPIEAVAKDKAGNQKSAKIRVKVQNQI